MRARYKMYVSCQWMAMGTNSTPTEIPSLGCGEFIQFKQLNCDISMAVKQPGYEEATLGEGSPGERLPST